MKHYLPAFQDVKEKMCYFSSIISAILLLMEYLFCDNIVHLNANGTTILGQKLFTIFDFKPYVAFWKIPYAEPPIGKLRFKPPKASRWFDQTTYNYSSPCGKTCGSDHSEDCLHFSIYMPYNKEISLAVLVWVHHNSNFHGPDFLIEEDIIVVTITYRNSVLGFLNTGDEFATGNMGAKDIHLALRWIRDNIIYFNGDPNRVTVMGSGSAANLVASFLISPMAEDLFTRVIMQSGSALSPADYKSYNFQILNKLYCNFFGAFEKFNRTRLYERLQNATVQELASVSRDLFDSTEVRDAQRLINSFGLTVEPIKRGAFMDDFPLNNYKRRMIKDVDVMMGYNSLESMYKLEGFVTHRKLLKYMNYNFQYLLPFEGRKDEYGSKQYNKIRRKIMDFYFVNGTIGERSLRRYAKCLSDQVIYPVLREARLLAERSSNHVYLYRFTFQGSFNVVWSSRLNNLRWKGATSGDEICYQFRCKSLEDFYNSPEVATERHFVKRIARLLGNFAKYGNPTPAANDNILGKLKWESLNLKKPLRGMNLGRRQKMVDLPEEKRVAFWDELRKEFFEDDDDEII